MIEDSKTHPLRKPCQQCGHTVGVINTSNGQDVVRCLNCGKYQYNAPRVETGRAVRSVATVHNGIKPNQRARIVLRSSGHCELCGRRTEDLHVGHLLSVSRGLAEGLTEAILNDDENLAAMCSECNLGLGDQPVPLRVCLMIALLRARTNAKGEEAA